MKQPLRFERSCGCGTRKFFIRVQLTGILLFLFLVQVHAAVYSQLVSIHKTKSSLESVFVELRKQTGYDFIYDTSLLKKSRPVSISVNDVSIEKALDEIFKAQPLAYTIIDEIIFIKAKTILNTPRSALQKADVSGKVIDETGLPLPGVSVRVLNKSQGAITDREGKFTIAAEETDSLVFTFVGYKRKSVLAAASKNLIIQMEQDKNTDLDEVAVVGFGTQRKISVVGAISTVSVSALKQPNRDLSNNLAGRISGIIAVQGNAEPGYDGSAFWIRGVSTFGANRGPLVLVDGIERALNNVDPEEIESFSVLKDATATAVYGVRGANGVILVNTKRGKSGNTQIRLRSEFSYNELERLPQFVDGAKYMELFNETRQDMGNNPVYSPQKIADTRNGIDPDLNPNVNWLDAITIPSAGNQRINLSVSGGSDKVRYFMSGAFYHETGAFTNDGLLKYNTGFNINRYNLRGNVDMDLSKTTLLRFSLGGYLTDRNSPGGGTDRAFSAALKTPPILFPIRFSDGHLSAASSYDNPWNIVTQEGYNQQWYNSIQTLMELEQKLDFITPGLKARGKFSFDTYNDNLIARTRTPNTFSSSERDENGNLVYNTVKEGDPDLNYSRQLSGNRTNYLEASLNYERAFKDHYVGGLLLFNQRNQIFADAGTATAALPYRNMGVAGRTNYSYKNRYFAEFNFGYNGSENFAKGKRFGFFPSVAAGWLVSSEPIMEPLKNVLSNFKLRASYGLAGNDQIGGGRRFAYLTTINGGDGFNYGPINNNGWTGIREGEFGNPNLTWETSKKLNLGVDIGLWNKLNITADWFRDRREDIFLARTSLPATTGFYNLPWANYGIMTNKGIDASVTFNQVIADKFFVSVLGNFTYAHNVINEQDEPNYKYDYQNRTGKRLDQKFGLISEGLFEAADFSDVASGTLREGLAKPNLGATVRPGDIKYKDVNGDGVIDNYDEVAIGYSGTPEIVYGFGLNITFKQFDLGVFFQGTGKVSRIIGENSSYIGSIYPFYAGNGEGNIYTNIDDRWTAANPSQNVFWPRLYEGNNTNNYRNSTFWLRDASFIRLKTLELGYTLSNSFSKKIGLKSLRVFARGTNLFVWDKIKLWDPELNTSSGMVYPLSRTYSGGIEIDL